MVPRGRISLRVPQEIGTGGVLLPVLHKRDLKSASTCACFKYGLFAIINLFWEHWWHKRLLIEVNPKLDGPQEHSPLISMPPFVYLLACTAAGMSVDYLEETINAISLQATAESESDDLPTQLHSLRQCLRRCESDLEEVYTHLPDTVNDYSRRALPNDDQYIKYRPSASLSHSAKRAKDLDQLLMNTFTLLLSNVSRVEACESRKQAERSVQLTQRATLVTILTFVFLPLSFATSLLGMSVGVGSQVKWWWI
jgi:hypothetical protein